MKRIFLFLAVLLLATFAVNAFNPPKPLPPPKAVSKLFGHWEWVYIGVWPWGFWIYIWVGDDPPTLPATTNPPPTSITR